MGRKTKGFLNDQIVEVVELSKFHFPIKYGYSGFHIKTLGNSHYGYEICLDFEINTKQIQTRVRYKKFHYKEFGFTIQDLKLEQFFQEEEV